MFIFVVFFLFFIFDFKCELVFFLCYYNILRKISVNNVFFRYCEKRFLLFVNWIYIFCKYRRFFRYFFFLNFKLVLFGWMEILIGGRFLIVRFLFFFIMLLYCWRSWMVLFCVIMLILRLGFWCLLFWILFGGFFRKLVNWMVRFGDFDIGIVGM